MTAASARLADTNARVRARSKPLASALSSWLQRLARVELAQALADPRAYAGNVRRIRKDDTPEKLRDDLERMVTLFGMREAVDAANRIAGKRILSSSLYRDAVENKPVKIKWFWEMQNETVKRASGLLATTKNDARESVRLIMLDALEEVPQPSPGEIARRIRAAFTGPGDTEREHRTHAKQGKRAFVFSSERAALIARTELAQAENTGIVAGYEATGVEEIEWLAYASSVRHGAMNGVRIKLGDVFTLPNGDLLRYPGDPSAKIRNTANCRCSTRAVLPKKRKSA